MRVLLALALLTGTAQAAEVTSTTPRWTGDFYVGYGGELDVIRLKDTTDGEPTALEVGSGIRHRHSIDLSGRFSVWHGIGLRLDLPIVAWDRTRWIEANQMVWDADRERPTMLGGLAVDGGTLDASSSSREHHGPDDLYFGFRVQPFGDDALIRAEVPASMALDVGFTFPSGENHDAVRDNGSAGAGEGGMGVHLALNASRRFPQAEPYLSVRYSHQAPYAVALTDRAGDPLPNADAEGNSTLDPADSFTFALGTEIIAQENVEADTGVRVGFGASFTYVSPDQVSSGTRVPQPLNSTHGHVATTAEYVRIEGQLQIRARTRKEVELRIDAGGGWVSDHTLEQISESAYGVQTAPGTFTVRFGAGALMRFR